MIIPIVKLIKAEVLLCFRIFIPVAISISPPTKKITSNSNIGHLISIDLCMNFISRLLVFYQYNKKIKVIGILQSSRRSLKAPSSHTTVRTVRYTAVQ